MSESDNRTTSYDTPSPLSHAIRWFRERVGFAREGSIRELLEEALEEESGASETISAEEKSLLKNMIHFGELTAGDVMVPRSEILAISRDVSLEQLRAHVVEIGHTRIPVFGDSLDAIVGFIHVKDLIPFLADNECFTIERVLRDILFIPPSMRIVDLLLKMRVSGCHIAIVVDEFGGTDGLVTMEDLFEELVGEIQDEHDGGEAPPRIRWLGDHILDADARVRLEVLYETFGGALTDDPASHEDVDTLGGLIFQRLGRVPVRGEVVMLKSSLKAEITAADPRRIRSVRLTRM